MSQIAREHEKKLHSNSTELLADIAILCKFFICINIYVFEKPPPPELLADILLHILLFQKHSKDYFF